jgi:hypothetical protein
MDIRNFFNQPKKFIVKVEIIKIIEIKEPIKIIEKKQPKQLIIT